MSLPSNPLSTAKTILYALLGCLVAAGLLYGGTKLAAWIMHEKQVKQATATTVVKNAEAVSVAAVAPVIQQKITDHYMYTEHTNQLVKHEQEVITNVSHGEVISDALDAAGRDALCKLGVRDDSHCGADPAKVQPTLGNTT